MKNTIFILFCLSAHLLFAQLLFEGKGQKLDSLNSASGQNYLVLHPEESSLSFTEERSGQVTTERYYETRSVAIDSLNWDVQVFPDWLGEKGMLSPIGYSDEGLYFNQVTFDKGMYYGAVLLRTGSAFSTVEIPFFRNKAPVQSGCISRSGQYMILSLESNNTYGVEDLYVVKRKPDGTWGQAKNLGYQLNTEFQEITPFLSEDNRTLFFATNGRGGEGSFDLFYTIRQDESWRNWSEPVSLGNQINTSGSETSFSYRDGEGWAYYISSQDSDGYGDVMRIKFKEDIEVDTVMQEEVVAEKMDDRDIPYNLVKLGIIDAQERTFLSSELIVDGQRLFSETGIFQVDSLLGNEVEIKSNGYLPKRIVLDERLHTGDNLIELYSIKKGSTITLDNVLFHRGTANLVEGSQRELDLVVEVMEDNHEIKILLKGHTDNTGDPIKNVQLSEERVKTVKAYILSQGISAYRVTGRGYGGNQPIASNATEETRKLNRRVEFQVLEE